MEANCTLHTNVVTSTAAYQQTRKVKSAEPSVLIICKEGVHHIKPVFLGA